MTFTSAEILADIPATMIAKVSDLPKPLGSTRSVADDVEVLRPLLAKYKNYETAEAAVIALHAVFLHRAALAFRPDKFAVPAAVLFGLGRALQPGYRTVPDEVVLNVIAHAIRAALAADDWQQHDDGSHLELARSWMAHAYLVAGVESGGAR
ncbi:hypothetical protein [Amycolatopsis regifaucium]|uniref:Uncharacterized protein n=1 Tax=Amycolatopsis regifaucium TaxID=546365 RepID=A0A154MF64_9PSEU|nr:hypothetical protein [Amycolatopsis regifaucium]KZB82757.1 hypothetical protein AVL48_37495 [Amycolatopsis regifaucium]OKA03127.1 hypothetical protein ATP06_0237830 [Amycolatopsis regifaucium]SFJ75934.1 hypothetical protein SAMN04489731_1452 [Amycolatopsis regifaucium]